ncbi:MAG: threonine/serine dehydratase [Pirellulaceae bacterium]
MNSTFSITRDDIAAAEACIRPYVHRTPVIHSTTLSNEFDAKVYLKLECLQKTGSFKPRGAFNKLLSLSADERARGVVGVSGGNHAQGLAYAARQLGIVATICMPQNTPANYIAATRGYGGQIVFAENIAGAFAKAVELERDGQVLVHPFDDPFVAAGQGTIAREILEVLPNLTRIYISIGGGGLIAGMATELKAVNPQIHIVGVETHGADAMAQSLAANSLIELPAITSIARTLGAPKVSEFTLQAVQQLVDEVVVVEDAEALDSLVFLLERTKTLVEPAAACCLAAARRHSQQISPSDEVVILLCGGNMSVADLKGSGA